MRVAITRSLLLSVTACLIAGLLGCGYSARSLLPSGYRTVYVENFLNRISVAQETNDTRMYRGYRHRLEGDITKAVTDRFILDGNLRIANPDQADLILKGELIDFKKEALRYDRNDTIEEYRIRLIVDIQLVDAGKNIVLWREKSFAGESTYRTTGSLATGEEGAIQEAQEDLARRIVERVIEGW